MGPETTRHLRAECGDKGPPTPEAPEMTQRAGAQARTWSPAPQHPRSLQSRAELVSAFRRIHPGRAAQGSQVGALGGGSEAAAQVEAQRWSMGEGTPGRTPGWKEPRWWFSRCCKGPRVMGAPGGRPWVAGPVMEPE